MYLIYGVLLYILGFGITYKLTEYIFKDNDDLYGINKNPSPRNFALLWFIVLPAGIILFVFFSFVVLLNKIMR